jgi:hypothetical protein
MPPDPFVREKFTRERTAAKKLAAEYFERFPIERYQTEVESWRHLQSQNIEFTMKRLRDPSSERWQEIQGRQRQVQIIFHGLILQSSNIC